MKTKFTSLYVFLLIAVSPVILAQADAVCTFNYSGTTMTLTANCTTDVTITIPDGCTLDGDDKTITAINPSTPPFLGAIIQNGDGEAHVTNLNLDTSNLTGCGSRTPTDTRLHGILFDGASGSITNCQITDINRGTTSGCQEGNAIEIRNAPFDGTHPDTQTVNISGNYIENYQKTGICANGDV
jgi:hypothetical protein